MKEKFDALVDHLLSSNIFMEQAIEILERSMIRLALERAGNKQSPAAKQLGIHRNTLLAKIRKYKFDTGRKPLRKPPARATRPRKRKTA
jgi:transcriptional regulator with PAS, ATPase and Fis domain